jgi:hypothetical protein
MTKELVTIEFRYYDKPKNEDFSGSENKIITIGIFNTFDEAIVEGNKALEVFEKHFKLNSAWNKKDRFGKTNGCFGYPQRLITPLAYLQTPFDFYAKIEQLKFGDVDQTITEILEAGKRYKEYRNNLD